MVGTGQNVALKTAGSQEIIVLATDHVCFTCTKQPGTLIHDFTQTAQIQLKGRYPDNLPALILDLISAVQHKLLRSQRVKGRKNPIGICLLKTAQEIRLAADDLA